jgi:hypothetical protein
MPTPLIVILMGSKADEAHCKRSPPREILSEEGAGRPAQTPEHVLQILRQYEGGPA